MGTQLIANTSASPWVLMSPEGVSLGIPDLAMTATWDEVRASVVAELRDASEPNALAEALETADELEKVIAAIRNEAGALYGKADCHA